MNIITITGNKPMELNIRNEKDERIRYIKKAIRQRVEALLDNGLEWVIISGQMGVELWAGEIVLQLKKDYPIKLAMIPPFLDVESRWPEHYQQQFQQVASGADFYKPLHNQTYQSRSQFIQKDYWLIHKTDGCVILVDEEYPGSVKYFMDKAKSAQESTNYIIQLITPLDLEELVREESDDM
ncbi:hypothetical protein J416_04788 [Gracilibacillus halophilus YIM-C55.5]|uniref:Uncharacterized protein n=1 Tax=Gracilibacillus halophilus YIM-C55.5 TaxID=1308866 RepID=N4WW39_9BACI|nr:SLOG family protein [Gracilibacillus halophilus]ENH97306.1 hypothetical protein J416_04788 [Gracilibacillus halophilus YIM-C55.5]